MELYIDTSVNPQVKLFLKEGNEIIGQKLFEAKYLQAEKLLVTIDELLKETNLELLSLKNIFIAEKGDSFSALRIGVITANTLAFALNIPVNDKGVGNDEFGVVVPIYDRAPNITIAKK